MLLAIIQVRLPWAGSRSGSGGPCSHGVGPDAAWGRDEGWGLSLLLSALASARVNLNIQVLSALKAAAPGNRGFAESAGKRRTRLRPLEPSSRRGSCLFPPGPSAEALSQSPPARPTPLRELRPGFAFFRLRQQLGGRDKSPDPPNPPARHLRGDPGPRTVRVRGRSQLLPPAPRVKGPIRAPGAAERAASRVLTKR